MGWFFKFMSSSVGKKIFMAFTGLLLCIYLIIHLGGNLTLFAGPELFNGYVEALSSIKPLVRVIEVLLALVFLIHILNSVWVTLENRKAGVGGYTVNKAGQTSTISSRTMMITGSIVFIFLAVHLQTFWYHFQVEHEGGRFYQIVMDPETGFSNPLVTVLYIVAMVLLGFHLRHGFQSAFQTFGIRYNRYSSLIETVAVFFWLIIPAGFVAVVIYLGFFTGGTAG